MMAIRQLLLFGLLSMTGLTAADVTVITGADPKPFTGIPAVTSADQFFRTTLLDEFYNSSASILMSSLDNTTLTAQAGIRPSSESFVRGAIQAWGEHQHLVIRPEEVWFSILVQMNFYMNKHAEDVRHLFVNFEGQQTIHIQDWNWYNVLIRFKDEIQSRVKTPWLLDWIMPKFSTTTESDIMTANVLMMGLTKAYFKFEGSVVCGLPSVTLLGTQADWEALLAKLDHLSDFGVEPTAYRARLKPILTGFVNTFKEPDAPATITFWNSIVKAEPSRLCGAPPYFISGWITGFFFWDFKGAPYAQTGSDGPLALDGVKYPRVGITTLPVGYAKVPFKMVDYPTRGSNFSAYVLAGTLGKQITGGPPAGYEAALRRVGNTTLLANASNAAHSTLKPMSGWLLYGPVDYNATIRYQREPELFNLTSSVSKNFGTGWCAGQNPISFFAE